MREALAEVLADLPRLLRRYDDIAVSKAGGFEDFVQEVRAAALAALANFAQAGDLKESLRRYVSGIARHIHADAVEALKKCDASLEEAAFEDDRRDNRTPTRIVGEQEASASIRKWLSELNDRDRQIVLLRHMHGRSYDEVAMATGLSVDQVDHALRRLHQSVRESLISSGTWRMLAGGR